jgi:hypothetical protein
VNVGLHQGPQRSIDHAVPFDGLLADESARTNAHLKVAAAVTGSGMAGVAAAIVDHVELVGLKGRLEASANQGDAFRGHGAT